MTRGEPTAGTIWYGDAAVSDKGGMNLPADARRAIGLDNGGTVLVFGEPGRLILTPVPLADDLLKFASERGAARFAEVAADDAS